MNSMNEACKWFGVIVLLVFIVPPSFVAVASIIGWIIGNGPWCSHVC